MFRKKLIANLFIYIFIISLSSPLILSSETRALTSGFRLDTPQVKAFDQSLLKLNNTGDPNKINERVEAMLDYQVTPGDIYLLVIEPPERDNSFPTDFFLTLQSNYDLQVPFLGTLNIKEKFFQDVRTEILREIKKQMPLRFISFNIYQLSEFDVFIYGGVVNPGIYTANPLTRISDIINRAGGSQPGSSLRRVELVRTEKTQYLDLSRFSTLGELSSNPTLKSNDKINVMRAQRLVTITGEINFPGKYDLLNGENLIELIHFAGNFSTDADVENLFIRRKEEINPYILNAADKDYEFILQNGDSVTIKPKFKPEKMVTVEGALFGEPLYGNEVKKIPQDNLSFKVPYILGMTALNLLDDFGGPTPLAQAKDSFIIRSATKERVPINAYKLWETREDRYNLSIEPGDLFYIPLKDKTVLVKGEVDNPQLIQHQQGQSIDYYLKAAGGLTDDGTNLFSIIDNNNSISKGTLNTIPEPGSTIIAEKNFWATANTLFSDISSLATVVTALIATYNIIAGLF